MTARACLRSGMVYLETPAAALGAAASRFHGPSGRMSRVINKRLQTNEGATTGLAARGARGGPHDRCYVSCEGEPFKW